MALISNGSMVLLKYKLNNVCDADHRPANGAQINAYYGNNAYCVRIKGVLAFNKVCPFVCKHFLLGLQAMKKT